MVSPDFSEFQFAYGLTRELEDQISSSVVVPPLFPTPNQEKKIGADVVMQIEQGGRRLAPLFIQYKRSSRMIRSYAREWRDFGQDYFRFDIHTANQHNTLKDMAANVGVACYVAPGFHTLEEYVRFHRNQMLARNSICFDVDEFPWVKEDDHRIAYTVNPLRGIFYSEPEPFQPVGDIYYLIRTMLEMENLFLDYNHLVGEFSELREQLIWEKSLQVEDYFGADDPIDWIRNQQQFFFEVADTQLLFLQNYD